MNKVHDCENADIRLRGKRVDSAPLIASTYLIIPCEELHLIGAAEFPRITFPPQQSDTFSAIEFLNIIRSKRSWLN